jgi:hypothetical protein
LLKENGAVKLPACPATHGAFPVLKTVLPSAFKQVAFHVVLEENPSVFWVALATLYVLGP